MTPKRKTLQEIVVELTEQHKHVERHTYEANGTSYTTEWSTEHASLLDQLEAATTLLGNADDGVRLGFGSRPSARIDAIDALLRIEHESGEWVKRPTIAGSVRAAASLVPSLKPCHKRAPRDRCCPRHLLEHQVQQWWTWARLTTGWDRPAWRPDATCPACGQRGGLRVRLDEDQRTAMCTNCRETWDEETIGHLALHIKAESECSEPGCSERARKDGQCATHSVTLATGSRRVTVRPLGEVSPEDEPTNILNGLTG